MIQTKDLQKNKENKYLLATERSHGWDIMADGSPSSKGEKRREVSTGILRMGCFCWIEGKNGGPSTQNQEDILKYSSAPLALS